MAGGQDRTGGILSSVSLGALTTTAANETLRAVSASGAMGPVLQRYKISGSQPPADQWVPVGIAWVVTTGITVTAAVVQLQKNGVAPNGPSATATLNGIVTMPIVALSAINEFFQPFSDYTFAAGPAAADTWSVKVITTSTAGVTSVRLVYYPSYTVLGVTDGVSY